MGRGGGAPARSRARRPRPRRGGGGAGGGPTHSAQGGTAEAKGIKLIWLRRRHRFGLWAWWPLVRYLRSERVDVLHAHMFGASVWATVIGRLCRVPVVIAHDHGWSYEPDLVRMFIDRHVLARASDLLVTVSRRSRQLMIEREGIPAEKTAFIPNGCPSIGGPTGADVRAELGIAPNEPVVGTVCMLRRQKALGVLLDAALLLRERFPGVAVLIAGRGPEQAQIEADIAERGLEATVRLLGMRVDVADVLACLDVAVCCSRTGRAARWRSWSTWRPGDRSSQPRWGAFPT